MEEGKPFWTHTPGQEVCPIYQCTRVNRGLPDCGRCVALPCGLFESVRDPSVPAQEHRREIGRRIERLKGSKGGGGPMA